MKELSLEYLPIGGEREDGYMSFPRALVQREMQSYLEFEISLLSLFDDN